MKFALIGVAYLLLQFLDSSCGHSKKYVKGTVTLVDIKQEGMKSPPVANFNLSEFNIFILKSGSIYYYYQPDFKKHTEFDEYRFEKLDKTFLHKSSFAELKDILINLISSKNLKNNNVWLAVEEYDHQLRDKVFGAILSPSGLTSATVGYITSELYTLLNTTQY